VADFLTVMVMQYAFECAEELCKLSELCKAAKVFVLRNLG